jgi:hypothetical protein
MLPPWFSTLSDEVDIPAQTFTYNHLNLREVHQNYQTS